MHRQNLMNSRKGWNAIGRTVTGYSPGSDFDREVVTFHAAAWNVEVNLVNADKARRQSRPQNLIRMPADYHTYRFGRRRSRLGRIDQSSCHRRICKRIFPRSTRNAPGSGVFFFADIVFESLCFCIFARVHGINKVFQPPERAT